MEKKIKVIILLLVVLVIAGLATHMFLTPSTVETVGSKNVTDMIGRNVEIPASVGSVVATSPPMTTVLYMIAPDKLKAVMYFTTYQGRFQHHKQTFLEKYVFLQH